MKKIYYALVGLMIITAVSCSESSDPVGEKIPEDVVKPMPMSIGAAVAETRMDYERSADNKFITVTWNDTDKLQVFNASSTKYNNSFVDFTMRSHKERTAIFETSDINPLSVKNGDDITAIYPYRVSSLSSTSKGTKMILMKNQTIQANGNGDTSMDLMVAHSTWEGANTSLQFTRLMGSIVLMLNFDKATKVKNVMLSADGGFNNYATIKMNATGGVTLGNFKKGPMCATVTNPTASTLYEGQIFFIPGTYSNITVTAITDRGNFVSTKPVSNLTLEKGKNYRLQVQTDAWEVAPLYAWGPSSNNATAPGFTEMAAATDEAGLYFLGNKSNYNNCVWSSYGDNMKFTLTNLSTTWGMFMRSSTGEYSAQDNFHFWTESTANFYPDWGGQNVLRVNVLSGDVKSGWRRNIYYVGNANNWSTSYKTSYKLKCDIDSENRIDEFTVSGLELNYGDEIKFPLDDYSDIWNGEFIKAKSANTSIYNGAKHTFVYGWTNYTGGDTKFRVNSSSSAGSYDITINVVDQTITFKKR